MAHLCTLRHSVLRPVAPLRCSTASASASASASSPGGSYLDMWRKAIERDRESQPLRSAPYDDPAALRSKTEAFNRLLLVPPEDRDHVQRLQVVDRAAAAIEAARAFLDDASKPAVAERADVPPSGSWGDGNMSEFKHPDHRTPGPDFWSWSPPLEADSSLISTDSLQPERQLKSDPKVPLFLMEKERSPVEDLFMPFESTSLQNEHELPLPPLQSLVEIKADSLPTSTEEHDIGEVFSRNAEEAAEALRIASQEEASLHGMYLDGSRWWKETGVEERPDGVICKWTLTRGVSADGTVVWEDKFWEASDQFDYKELGSEKSGRNAAGDVWHEFWRESLWKDSQTGLTHVEKTADKQGKSRHGTEWGEKWWEHYDSSGQADKWADKWCSIDHNKPLEAGHAHVWHERWGEKYDGHGGSVKYTDKWAERWEGDGWSKWGDKWDEHFNSYGHGLKQGETWWQGKHGEWWNRTWGEGHNGSGWIHKYGKSSGGEHWDTHVREDTWYERYPHFGFDHCLENSVQLQAVPRQSPPELD